MSDLFCTDGVKCELGCKDEKLCEFHGIRVRTHYLAPIVKDLQEQLEQSQEYINTLHTMTEQYSGDVETLKTRNEKLDLFNAELVKALREAADGIENLNEDASISVCLIVQQYRTIADANEIK